MSLVSDTCTTIKSFSLFLLYKLLRGGGGGGWIFSGRVKVIPGYGVIFFGGEGKKGGGG